MVAALPERAQAMNADPRYLHRVDRLAVFGSFLTDKPTLGDLDIFADLRVRVVPKTDEDNARFRRHFPPPDYIRRDFMSRLFWPELKFRRDLRIGPGMHIHDWDELERLGCPYRLIFEADEASCSTCCGSK